MKIQKKKIKEIIIIAIVIIIVIDSVGRDREKKNNSLLTC